MKKRIFQKAFIIFIFVTFAVNFGYSVVHVDIQKKLEKAKSHFNKGNYTKAKKLLLKNLTLMDEINISDQSMRGECFLLLGAIHEKFKQKKNAKWFYSNAKNLGIENIEGVYISDLRLYRKIIKEEDVPKKNFLRDILQIFITGDYEIDEGNFIDIGIGKQNSNDFSLFETHAHQNYQELSKWWEVNATSNLYYDFDNINEIIYPSIKYGHHFGNNRRGFFKYLRYSKSYNFRIYNDESDILSTERKTTISCFSLGIETPILNKFQNLLIGGELQRYSFRVKATHYIPELSERKVHGFSEDAQYCQYAIAPYLVYRPIFNQHVFLNISIIYTAIILFPCKHRPYVGKFGENHEFYIITALRDNNIDNEEVKAIFDKCNIKKVDNFNITSGLRIEFGLEIKF